MDVIVLGVLVGVGLGLFCFVVDNARLRREQQRRQRPLTEMRSIFANARKGEITKDEGDKFFECVDEILKDKMTSDSIKKEVEKMSSQITMVLAVRTKVASVGEEVDKLAALRQKGMISDLEFKAFSERFKMSTEEKARGVVRTISDLSEQRKQGAMSDGNYHAALWSLLDKLDRKT